MAADEKYLPTAGGQMQGPLYLAGFASSDLEAVPFQQLRMGPIPEGADDGSTPGSVLEEIDTVTILGGLKSLVVIWTATNAVHGNGFYEVQIATNITFTDNVQTAQTKATVATFDGLTTGNTYYARVTPVAASGVRGPTTVANPIILGGASGADIANAAIDTVHISDDAITAPKILAGEITGLHIAAGSIGADHIAANQISGGHIVAGVSLSAPLITGGTLQTATSGSRIVITSNSADRIIFTTSGGEMGYIASSPGGISLFSEESISMVADAFAITGSGQWLGTMNFSGLRVNNATVLTTSNHSHGSVPSGTRTTSAELSSTTSLTSSHNTGTNNTSGTPESNPSAFTGIGPGNETHQHRMASHTHPGGSHSHQIGQHTHTVTI